jgi:hypothetical protein
MLNGLDHVDQFFQNDQQLEAKFVQGFEQGKFLKMNGIKLK